MGYVCYVGILDQRCRL